MIEIIEVECPKCFRPVLPEWLDYLAMLGHPEVCHYCWADLMGYDVNTGQLKAIIYIN